MMTKSKLVLLFLLFGFVKNFSQEKAIKEDTQLGKVKAESFLKVLQQHYANGDYQLHKNYSDSLLLVSEKYGLTKMYILALNNQAVYYNNRSEKQLAIERYHLALEKCKLIPNDYRPKAIVLVNMGNTYQNIDAQNKCIKTMEEVLSIADKLKNPDKIKAAALIGLSNSYNKLGDLKPALEYAYQVKALGEKLQNESFIATSLTNIADIHVKLKQYTKAIEATTAALELSVLKKSVKSRGWALLNRGIANYHLNNLTAAKEDLLACEALSGKKNIVEIEMYAHKYLAMLYEKNKDFEASYAEQKEYSQLKERHENDTKSATKKDLNTNIAAQNKKIEASEQELIDLSENSAQVKFWGVTMLVLATLTILFLLIRRRKIKKEHAKLRTQQKALLASLSNLGNTSSTLSIETDKKAASTKKPYENSSLTEADRTRYKNKILACMENDKPYLDADLTQTNFASKIGISSYHFSEVLHYGFEQNFYNFINAYRIVEAQNLIKQTAHTDVKMIAIAFDSGFKNKASFNRVFKKHTGLTPSEYKKTL
ncbi:helix-turn-helix domain-containing protein [Maribacter sp. 2-571]|uniref:helix-turn-helix domain-containing protein n=1 Tax=Maribacter sp. 2-571 TaxID=3417569 RepID=UPI003D34062E